MARNYARLKARQKTNDSRRQRIDEMAYAADLEGVEPQPTKGELRNELAEALERFRGPVQRLSSRVALRCRSCGHRGTAMVPQGAMFRFKCSACGSRLVSWRV